VRAYAADALGRIRDTRAVDALTTALKDEDFLERTAAPRPFNYTGASRGEESQKE